MTTLRLIVLILGIVIIAGVWWWSRRQQRTRAAIPTRRVERLPAEPSLDRPLSRVEEGDEDIDFAGTLADLSGLMRESREERHAGTEARDSSRRRGMRRAHPQQIDMGFPESPLPQEVDGKAVLPERVVALYVQAPAGSVFTGPAIARALSAVDMRFGAMSIYHHHGVGKLKSPEPLFSAANMFEPGTFEPARLDSFTTGGLALFMQLPARREASLIFELMLNTAQRLAEQLRGEALDDTREPLTSQSIEQLRALVRQYDYA